MPKSPDAFRTISEVAEWLGVQAHVLRFWESKFSQVKPIKRAGGRRYYRPADMLLIGGIKKLLHDDGLTIKGVQKILREQGASHVADQSQPLDDLTAAVLDAPPIPDADVIIDAEPETAEIVELTPAHAAPDPEPLQDPSPEGETITDEAPEQVASTEDDMVAVAQDTTEPETVAASAPQAAGLDDAPVSSDAEDVPQDAQPDEIPDVAPAQTDEPETLGEADSDAVPSFLRRPLQDFVELPSEPDTAIEAPPAPRNQSQSLPR